MEIVKMRWEGAVDTRAYIMPGEEKQEILTGQEFDCELELASKLFRYDKKFVIIDGINDHEGRAEKKEKAKAEEKAKRKYKKGNVKND